MGVLSSLVSQAQPALFGLGVTGAATTGATWLWNFVDLNDTAGDPIDLTGVTGTCEVVDSDEAVVVELTFVGNDDGTFSVGLDEEFSMEVAPGQYRWRFDLYDGDDRVQMWGHSPSKFTVKEA